MRFPSYHFIYINPRKASNVRHIHIPFGIVLAGVILSFICIFGLCRIGYFAATLGLSKAGLYQEKLVNERLLTKVHILDKIYKGESKKIHDLIDFEDRTRLAYGMDPISEDIRKAGIGGNPAPEEVLGLSFKNSLLLKAEAVRESLSVLVRRTELQNSTFQQVDEQVEQFHKYWSARPAIWPALGSVTSGFGIRPDPISGLDVFHEGIDIANAIGTPVYAPANGVIKAAGFKQDYGRAIVVNHSESGYQTIYGHLSRYVVSPNQSIKRGELIGYIGNSGKSTGPHLHYEIVKNDCPVNPLPFILPTNQVID